MARLTDEQHFFREDTREKAITARSAHHTRTHCGKGGAVKLPSDNMSKEELNAMNGECVTYRLNSPMTWDEFKAMPEDIQAIYIKALRKKFGVPDAKLAECMNVHKTTFSAWMRCIGCALGSKGAAANRLWSKTENCNKFVAWWNGVEYITPVEETEPTETPEIVTVSCPDHPITWKDFKKLPEQIRIDYVNYIRERFNAPDKEIAVHVLKCDRQYFGRYLRSIGLGLGKKAGGKNRIWDSKGFYEWAGVNSDELIAVNDEPEIEVHMEEETVVEEPVVEEVTRAELEEVVGKEKAEIIEEQLQEVMAGFEYPIPPVTVNNNATNDVYTDFSDLLKEIKDLVRYRHEAAKIEQASQTTTTECATPTNGYMTFEGKANEVIRSISMLLGDKHVHLKVEWDVLE